MSHQIICYFLICELQIFVQCTLMLVLVIAIQLCWRSSRVVPHFRGCGVFVFHKSNAQAYREAILAVYSIIAAFMGVWKVSISIWVLAANYRIKIIVFAFDRNEISVVSNIQHAKTQVGNVYLFWLDNCPNNEHFRTNRFESISFIHPVR